MISKAHYVQDDAYAWWIDSGATTHVCKDRFWFERFTPVKDGSVLYMGDDHRAPIEGRGDVTLEFSSSRSIKLCNVLYVARIRKNLVSGSMLNKLGYKQVFESDKYVLSKHGDFVGFRYFNNGMFMLNLTNHHCVANYVCMASNSNDNSTLWHARLGHVHFRRMQEMSKTDLIPALSINMDKM